GLSPSWQVLVPTAAVVGEPVVVTGVLRSRAPADLVLELSPATTQPFTLASARQEPGRVEGGVRSQAFSAEVVPLVPGEVPFATRWRVPGAPPGEALESPPVVLRAAEPKLPPGQQELRDIKGPRAARPAIWPWLLLAAALAAAWEARRRWRA